MSVEPMEPPDTRWWPAGLSQPSGSGSQNGGVDLASPKEVR